MLSYLLSNLVKGLLKEYPNGKSAGPDGIFKPGWSNDADDTELLKLLKVFLECKVDFLELDNEAYICSFYGPQ